MQRKSWSFSSRKPPLRPRYDSAPSAGNSTTSGSTERLRKSEQGGSSGNNFRYAAAAVQGFRPVMQDNFSCVPASTLNREPLGCFAVFDGHGNHGDVVSQYCTDHFIGCFLSRKALRESRSLLHDTMAASLRKTFLKFDQQLREVVQNQKSIEKKVDFVFSGTTATMAVVLQKAIVIANAGDSRTLLCRSGSLQFATTDHNPGSRVEDDRIEAAGGTIHTTPSKHKVILDTEAYTNLAVSRTLGDFGFKNTPKFPAESQIVSPVPDVTVLERDLKTDEFLLLASDGVFKSLTNSDVIEFVSRQLTLTDDLTRICHSLIAMSYYSPHCVPDDTTVVLVVFPAAPTVSPKTISEEEMIEAECMKAIEEEIEKIVSEAEGEWVLENEFNIIQKLVTILPPKYCVQLRNKFIKKTLSDAKLDRFGVKDLEPQKRASHSETDDDSDVYTPEITTNNIHPEAIVKPESGPMDSDNISANDHIGATDPSPPQEEDKLDTVVKEGCSNDNISKLGVPIPVGSSSSETCPSQEGDVNLTDNSSSTIM